MKFEAGKTYWYSYVTDEDHAKIYLEIVSRTEKSAVIRHDGEQTTQRKKIYTDENGDEWLRPNGTYSMCPVCRANHTEEPEVAKFEAGKTYKAYEHDGETYKIVKRTKHYAIIENSAGEKVRKEVAVYAGWEDTEAINVANWPTLEYLYARDEVETESTMTDLETALEGKNEREDVEEILEKFSETTLKEYMKKKLYFCEEICDGWKGCTKADFVEQIVFHVAMKSQGLREMYFI